MGVVTATATGTGAIGITTAGRSSIIGAAIARDDSLDRRRERRRRRRGSRVARRHSNTVTPTRITAGRGNP
jgi:hypothetical protein